MSQARIRRGEGRPSGGWDTDPREKFVARADRLECEVGASGLERRGEGPRAARSGALELRRRPPIPLDEAGHHEGDRQDHDALSLIHI